MESHDAIVVGAGPAGSTASLHLARAGLRVLLLEKGPPGRDKPCGGGLTVRAWRELEVPIDDLITARVDRAEVRCGRTVRHARLDPKDAVMMVLRREWDRRMQDAAAAAGAEVHHGEPVAALDADGWVRTARGPYRASVVLLATGAEAPLRSTLGLPPPARMAVAVEMEGPTHTAPDGRSMILDLSAVHGGYAWAFPKGERWNAGVGVGLLGSSRPPDLRARLARFLDAIGLRFAATVMVTGRRIPLGDGRRLSLRRGRVLLLGDAAGCCDPLTGEGIPAALVTGRLAAQAVLDGCLGRYSCDVDLALSGHLHAMRHVARLVYSIPGLVVGALTAPPVERIAVQIALTGPLL